MLRHHKNESSVDVLTNCANDFYYYVYHFAKSEDPANETLVDRFGKLRSLCQEAMDQQARGKWMTFERMGL